jgi:hypothetical protein
LRREADFIRPPFKTGMPKAVNVHLSFEEALKLHLSLGQLLGHLNKYNRSTRRGRRTCANLCVYLEKNRVTVQEGLLRAGRAEPGEPAEETEAQAG